MPLVSTTSSCQDRPEVAMNDPVPTEMATTERYPPIVVSKTSPQTPALPPRQKGDVTAVGQGITVNGTLIADEHIIIEGFFEGEILTPDHGVAIGATGNLRGDVSATAITVLGRVEGNLTASTLIELRATAIVRGRLVSPNLSIEEGALFQGTVDPTKTATILAVSRHRMSLPNIAEPTKELGPSDT